MAFLGLSFLGRCLSGRNIAVAVLVAILGCTVQAQAAPDSINTPNSATRLGDVPGSADAPLGSQIAPSGGIAVNPRSTTDIATASEGISVPGTAGALRTKSVRPRELLGVNSILVARPKVSSDLANRPELVSSLYRIIEETARAQLGMDLVFEDEGQNSDKAHGKGSVDKNVDAVLRTSVTRYIDRSGSRIGSEQLAAVDFAMELQALDAKTSFWEGSYHFRDQALTENLLRADQVFEDGVHLRTAPGLFRQGVEQALRELSETREKQFLSAKPVK